jgi:excinuclease ABC subunit B
MLLYLEKDRELPRETALKKLVEIHYERGDYDFSRGRFRVRGDVLDIYPAHEEDRALRIYYFGDTIEAIQVIDPLTGKTLSHLNRVTIYPASHYVTTVDIRERAMENIKKELKDRVNYLRSEDKLIEAQRIEERTLFDLEMMMEMGYCHGIENYSRHLTGRSPGEPPPTLLDYFPRDFLVMVDESHITIPQLNAMYNGDRSRKETLVNYGFRLPSALDNRPLKFDEFEAKALQVIYVSATPGPYELEKGEMLAEQIIRPTGLMDPEIVVQPAVDQVDNLLGRIRERVGSGERILVTTLTKRMAEDLTDYLSELGVKVRYLHSDIKTIERMEIIRDLRLGQFDVLVGINLLREGLDLPEVSLVAILDADKEGFLRSERSLIQTCGRAARNIHGQVVLYADRMTPAMNRAIDESNRRRAIQEDYNEVNGITPTTIQKNIGHVLGSIYEADYAHIPEIADEQIPYLTADEIEAKIEELTKKMKSAAEKLAFEEAAQYRDEIRKLGKIELEIRKGPPFLGPA